MQLTLDPDHVRACMALWRDALALPGHARGEAQEALLSRVTSTLVGWCDLLGMCSAVDDDATVQELNADILRFKGWINDAIVATQLARDLENLGARIGRDASKK
jgi:hypothetical protein